MTDPQSWFVQLQQQITNRVGEPVFLTINMCFDDWFEVELSTFTSRWGIADGRNVEVAIGEAVEMLLEMDKVVAEVVASRTLRE